MDSVDKLRDYASRYHRVSGQMTEMSHIADEIEAEIAERYMELPVDADGVPIRVGDKMDKGEVFAVAENPGDGAVWFTCNSGFNEGEYRCEAFRGYCHRHVKPRTLESVLLDMLGSYYRKLTGSWATLTTDEELASGYADEIRELMGGDAE